MKIKIQFSLICILLFGLGLTQAWSQETTFDYTGGVQTYTVPIGVTSIQLEAWGAQGGTGTFGEITPDPGLGGYSVGSLEVTPGDVLNIYVGGAGESSGPGGYNGGGQAGTDYGAAGGGASDVRSSPYTLTDRVIVGAGGGGAAFGSTPSNGGHGGALIGLTGEDGDSFVGGGGGTQVAGGAAGCCYGAATGGLFGIGGGPGDYHNAGGGGGWYGGGSGAGQAGAGGGSSYIFGLIDGETTAGLRTGDGQVIISILCNALTVTVSDDEICIGQEVTLTAVSDVGGEITWEGDIENGVPFAPDELGFVEFNATSDGEGDCGLTVTITVWNLPDVEIDYDGPDPICFGDEITLSGDGADSYDWELDVIDGEPFVPEVGVTDYTVIGTSGPGCMDLESITIEVFEAASVDASVTDDVACFGQSVTFTGSGCETYLWSPEDVEDGVAFTPAESGTFMFYVTGTDANGCTDQDSVEVFVNEEILITYTTAAEVVGEDGSIDITVTGGSPPYEFDWDNDGTGDFDDTEDLAGLTAGTYAVIVQDNVACTANSEITVDSQVGIGELDEVGLNVYPNPTTDFITVELEGIFTYELTNINGVIITQATATDKEVISLENVADGVYFVMIKSDDSIHTFKVVKN
ncbi:MAG: T9SS type A sorting domain-containing protein [Crocinitomix sp.]|nr:T9SS type A sorting domain-containing protein [Crocinitomix sp.]